jgi:VanZ family protein
VFLAWTGVVAVGLAMPAVPLPPGVEVPLAVGLDKLAHSALVFVHGLLGRRWLAALRVSAPAAVAAAAALGFSLALEALQQWIPGRSSSAGDALADAVGALLCLLPWRFARSGGAAG